jgi:SAM-dependent methyltransferase
MAAERRARDHENSEWRKQFWAIVNKDNGGATVPATLSETEMEQSWEQLEEHDEAAESEATRAMDDSQTPALPPDVVARYERDAAAQWDAFYGHFSDRFFKDRNYLQREFPELFARAEARMAAGLPPVVALEIGCGAGNTAIPLLETIPAAGLALSAFDFSAKAVEVMRSRPGFDAARCHSFVCDVADGAALAQNLAGRSVDIAMAVFALSALSPERLPAAAAAIFSALAPGGMLLFRDYGVHDIAQARFVAKSGRKLGENFYLRGDGTRVYFFSKAQASRLFAAAGFEVADLRMDTRVLRNRKRDIAMKRVWITGKLLKPTTPTPATGDT